MVLEVVFLEIFFLELESCCLISQYLLILRSMHGKVLIRRSSAFLGTLVPEGIFLVLLKSFWVFYLWGTDFFFLNIVLSVNVCYYFYLFEYSNDSYL